MSHKDVAPQLRQLPSFLPCRCWTRPQRTTWSTWAPAPRPCSATRPAWPRAPRPRWRLASLASVRTLPSRLQSQPPQSSSDSTCSQFSTPAVFSQIFHTNIWSRFGKLTHLLQEQSLITQSAEAFWTYVYYWSHCSSLDGCKCLK